VTVHEADINVNGWTGCGYTILDSTTGAGVYKIAGGMNGGWLLLQGFFGGFLLTVSLLGALVGIGTLLGALFLVLAVVLVIFLLEETTQEENGCLFTGFNLGWGLALEEIGDLPRGIGTILGILAASQNSTSTTQLPGCMNFN